VRLLGHDEFFSLQWREPATNHCFYGCYMVNQNLRPCLGQPGRAEQSAPVTETEQAPGKNEPGNDQPSPRRTAGSNRGVPPSAVRDERGAGSSGDHKDFPAAAAKLTSAVHPSEKTTVLSLSVTDLLPHTGSARVSYILGSFEKAQSGQNRLGTTASDETVVRITLLERIVRQALLLLHAVARPRFTLKIVVFSG